MAKQETDGMKVYSPDIKPYSFEGRSGVFGTLLSIIVAPIRITTRIMHNIFILPSNLQESYADGLLLVSAAMAVIGIVDLFMYKKWPMVVSQIPAIYYAIRLKKQAMKSTAIASAKREVDIDFDGVEELCESVFDDLEKIVKE